MSELQSLFTHYNIDCEFIERLSDTYIIDIEKEFSYILGNRSTTKIKILLDHDVFALGHSKRQITENSEYRMILTWDRIMIEVAQNISNCGWVVSPDIASVFLQPYRPINEKHFCRLAHTIARSQVKPLEVTARIIDTIVTFASQKLQDWEFIEKINTFKNGILDLVDFNKPEYLNWVDKEIEKFLINEGIKIDISKQLLPIDR